MEITIKHYDEEASVKFEDGSDIFEVMRQIRGVLIAAGFHENSVIEGCEFIVEEYGEKDEKPITE